jgi:WhiB family redox-sensing transcriptional regulator
MDTASDNKVEHTFYIDRFFEELRSIMEDRQTQSWRDDALCRGVGNDRFFSGRGDNEAVDAAQELCGRCPVAEQCGQYAMSHRLRYGIWGGLGATRLKQMAVGVPRAEQRCVLCSRRFVPSAKGQVYCGQECVREEKNRQRRA